MISESEKLRRKGDQNNYPGFKTPLMFAPMQDKHRQEMYRALLTSHKHLRGFIGWAKYFGSWSNKEINMFLDDHINAPLPDQHFVFTLENRIVGVGSLIGCYTPFDAQIALWVVKGYQGKGIGKKIVDTLTHVAFDVWGFERLYYEHDAMNQNSKKLPQKCGFSYSHSFDAEKAAEKESGLWMSWVKKRPDGLPDGIIQGKPLEDFSIP